MTWLKILSLPLSFILWWLIQLALHPFSLLSKRTWINARKFALLLKAALLRVLSCCFFVFYGVWILHYLNISLPAICLAGGILLLLVALDLLASRRQTPRKWGNDTISTNDGGSRQCCWQSGYCDWLWPKGWRDAGNSNRFNHCQPCRILDQPGDHVGLFADRGHHFSHIIDSMYHWWDSGAWRNPNYWLSCSLAQIWL